MAKSSSPIEPHLPTTNPNPDPWIAGGRGTPASKNPDGSKKKSSPSKVKTSKTKKFMKYGFKGLNALMWAWMAYDVLKMTGALGADTEADSSTMAGMEGINMRQAALQRGQSQEMSRMSQQSRSMQDAARLGQGRQQAEQFFRGGLDSQLDEYLATRTGTIGAASLMNPVAQNNIAHLSQTGLL